MIFYIKLVYMFVLKDISYLILDKIAILTNFVALFNPNVILFSL